MSSPGIAIAPVRRWFPLLVWTLPVLLAGAAQAAPTTAVRSELVYELAADGSWTVDGYSVTRINEQAAVNAAGRMALAYSDSLAAMEVTEAYTTTRDGTRIDVPAERIVTQQAPASAGAPMYSDVKVRNIVFPQVEVGATLTLRWRLRQHTPYLPGVFGDSIAFSRFTQFEQASLTLRAPADRTMHVHSQGVNGGPVPSAVAGRREWRWTHGPAAPETPEPGMLAPESISPRVTFSTLPDYPAFAAAYQAGAAPAAKVTPAVRKLADEITRGVAGRRAQAEAIYRWVSGEVRYVALAMGTGGFVPHQADQIIAARYGDCKDKTTLLVSLLAAKGIRAVPVLIHAGSRHTLPELAVIGAFNHAIAYVPEFDLYLDATFPLAPFSAIPEALRGRPVLIVGDGSTKARVQQIPFPAPARDRSITRTVATAAADGTVSGTTSFEVLGSHDGSLRSSLSRQPAQDLPQLARNLLSGTGQTGTASMNLGDLHDFSNGRLFTVDFVTPARISLPGPGALTGSFGAQDSSARGFVASIRQVERRQDFPCPAAASEELLELELPAGVRITHLPAAARVESPFGSFTASHVVKDGKLLVGQRLEVIRTRTVCNAADHAVLREFATAIDRELRKQILYE